MNIVILVSPLSLVYKHQVQTIHLNPQCNIKVSILINSTWGYRYTPNILEIENMHLQHMWVYQWLWLCLKSQKKQKETFNNIAAKACFNRK